MSTSRTLIAKAGRLAKRNFAWRIQIIVTNPVIRSSECHDVGGERSFNPIPSISYSKMQFAGSTPYELDHLRVATDSVVTLQMPLRFGRWRARQVAMLHFVATSPTDIEQYDRAWSTYVAMH